VAERFFCPELRPGAPIVLTGAEAHHLARVRRVRVGDCVELFDGTSDSALVAELRETAPARVVAIPTGQTRPGPRTAVELTLGVALPKGERLDWLVEKAVEVGVATLQPLLAERSVVDPRPAKLDRLRRHVVEASKQCGRNRLMAIEPVRAWNEWIGSLGESVKLLANRGGLDVGRWPSWSRGRRLALAVGPEGGCTDAEVEAARELGWVEVNLGPTVLRIETAALVGSALILNRATTGDTR
jgi:16S rRNA (uracil1498-N3)-methyltransferase